MRFLCLDAILIMDILLIYLLYMQLKWFIKCLLIIENVNNVCLFVCVCACAGARVRLLVWMCNLILIKHQIDVL